MIRNLRYLKSVGTLICEDTLETFPAGATTSLYFLRSVVVAIDDDLLELPVEIENVTDEWLNCLSGQDALTILLITIKTKEKMKDNKKELKTRVKNAKLIFSQKGITRDEFVNNVFGTMTNVEFNRIHNLWGCKVTDLKFTEQIEDYAKHRGEGNASAIIFKRFTDFIIWYTQKVGAEPLTVEQIEKAHARFVEDYEKFKD